MPMFVLVFGDKGRCIIPATGCLPPRQPTRGKRNQEYEHQFSSTVFKQV